MPTYVALLRGINVSGQRLIKMADLRGWIGALGYRGVATYIQSGNVVCVTGSRSRDAVAKAIREKIRAETSFDVPVVVRTAKEIARIVEKNPFPEETEHVPKLVHVAFLAAKPSGAALAALGRVDAGQDRFQASGKELYLHYATGSARSKLNNVDVERVLGVSSTARNWNTVVTLDRMARGADE